MPEADNFFAVLKWLYVFMSGSYVCQKWVEVQKEIYEGQPRELQRLSDTRWVCRQSPCQNQMDIHVLEDNTHESSGDRAVDAQGLLYSGFLRLQLSYRLAVNHVREVSPP